MGRPRKHGTTLPPYLYLRRGRYSMELPGKPTVNLGSDPNRALAEYAQRCGPAMVFTGDAEESAKVLFGYVAEQFKGRLEQERATALAAGE